jgi:flavin reductase (DIM6/NTAB) family NADH-FMN oxidoreductase RutF
MTLTIDAASLDAEGCYKLLSGVVVPRPIAWITTQSAQGVVNLAPFSCYTYVCSKPPMVGINIGLRNGEIKDTHRNILENKEFVVNIGDETMIEPIHRSADEYPPEVSEVELLGLPLAPCTHVRTPRLAIVPAALECRLHSVQEFGDTRAQFVVGEVLAFHFRDGLHQNGRIDTRALRPLARVGGPTYARLGEFIDMAPVARTPQRVTPAPGGTTDKP